MSATQVRRFNQWGRVISERMGKRFYERRKIETSVTHKQLEQFAAVHPYVLARRFRGRRAQ